ncbi:hypothetical protein FNV43_RR00515 [Rhamnella rubrinervis]|uniref:Uncharacterized protein n=1 Tax=Rhamnella rubrinervis TaxID=2594499 RepID=A0A8K0MS35_9ROSA|nr:hypothetical protein FNV43_RR00515 [Rhamnella rubrinervis]
MLMLAVQESFEKFQGNHGSWSEYDRIDHDSRNHLVESERKAFHFIDVNGEDPDVDTCGICGDGGDLILSSIPEWEWHV